MKKLFFFALATVVAVQLFAQGNVVFFENFDTFSTNHGYIDTASSWYIGAPQKADFDTAYSGTNAIFTDTSFYRVNDSSSFIYKFRAEDFTDFATCQGCLSFWHQYSTSKGRDGGFVEIKYEGYIDGVIDTSSWMNVVSDTLPFVITTDNFYDIKDTIIGGNSAFSGDSTIWQNSRICWVWFFPVKQPVEVYWDKLYLKFTFESDSIPDSLGGWIIDDIELQDAGFPCTTIQEKGTLTSLLKVSPNPAGEMIRIDNKNLLDIERVEVYDATGSLLKILEWQYSSRFLEIPTWEFSNGFLLIKTIDREGNFGAHRVILSR